MQYIHYYNSPMGQFLLTADESGLTGLLFENEECQLDPDYKDTITPAIKEAIQWLDEYFSGKIPTFMPPLHLVGSSFQQEVWKLLLEIPYGEISTYGDLAKKIAADRGIKRMSAQAVGGAVGSNPVSIIVPCHRVIGSGNNLTGYASGLDHKIFLMKLEGHNIESFKDPRK